MNPVLLEGKTPSAAVRDEVSVRAADFAARTGRKPSLAVILAGDDPASRIYVRGKHKACEKTGIDSRVIELPASATTGEIRRQVEDLNADPNVDGILVQLPLPAHADTGAILDAVDPQKDADGFHSVNVGRLWTGRHVVAPCTPAGIIRILDHYHVPIQGRHALVIGRSTIVGKPMAALLLERHATVTIAHSRTASLPALARTADILVAAIGKPAFVTREFIREGAVVVDVGVNRLDRRSADPRWLAEGSPLKSDLEEKGTALVGDVDPVDAAAIASHYTPVPGGVGLMTVAMLLMNTVTLARLRIGL